MPGQGVHHRCPQHPSPAWPPLRQPQWQRGAVAWEYWDEASRGAGSRAEPRPRRAGAHFPAEAAAAPSRTQELPGLCAGRRPKLAESSRQDCEREYVKYVGETETGDRPRRQGEMKFKGI